MTKGEQMMADLGYEPDTRYDYGPDKRVYIKRELEEICCSDYYIITIENTQDGKYVEKDLHTGYPATITQAFDFNELLACAEIVKEIKENG